MMYHLEILILKEIKEKLTAMYEDNIETKNVYPLEEAIEQINILLEEEK